MSGGQDGCLVATPVDGSMMQLFARALTGLADSYTDGSRSRVLQLLSWHLEQGILQVHSTRPCCMLRLRLQSLLAVACKFRGCCHGE